MLRLLLPLLLVSSAMCGQDSLADAYALRLLRTLHDTIGYYHPAVQNAKDRAAYEATFDRAAAQLQTHIDAQSDSVGIQDWVLAAGLLQQHIQCGHLTMYPKRGDSYFASINTRRQYAPYLTTDDKLVLRAPFDIGIDTLPKGTEFLSIDGRPVMEILQKLAVFRGANDEGYERATLSLTALSLSSLYQSRYRRRDSMTITYLEPIDDVPRSATFAMDIPETELPAKSDTVKLSKRERKRAKKESQANFHRNFFTLNLSPDSTAWVLKIASFGNEAYKYTNYDKLLRRTFDTINESGLDKLILDLTYNGGGSIVKARNLVRYLVDRPFAVTDEVVSTSPTANGYNLFSKIGGRMNGIRKRDGVWHFGVAEATVKPEKDRFTGEVVAIINEGSFSATTIVANTLMELDAATVIGSKTGGGRSALFGGKIRDIDIGEEGHLNFRIRVPNWMYVPLNAEPGTVTPQILISETKQDLLDGIDPRMDAALEILNGPSMR